jgi:hypothetical protein
MSLTMPLPSPGPVPALASSRPGSGPWPEVVTRPASIAALGDALAENALDNLGHGARARIVPPTTQNLGATEADLAAFVASVPDLPHTEAVRRPEMLIRPSDLCISAAHLREPGIAEDGALEGNA